MVLTAAIASRLPTGRFSRCQTNDNVVSGAAAHRAQCLLTGWMPPMKLLATIPEGEFSLTSGSTLLRAGGQSEGSHGAHSAPYSPVAGFGLAQKWTSVQDFFWPGLHWLLLALGLLLQVKQHLVTFSPGCARVHTTFRSANRSAQRFDRCEVAIKTEQLHCRSVRSKAPRSLYARL